MKLIPITVNWIDTQLRRCYTVVNVCVLTTCSRAIFGYLENLEQLKQLIT